MCHRLMSVPRPSGLLLFGLKISNSQIPALEQVALALAASRETAAAANLHRRHIEY